MNVKPNPNSILSWLLTKKTSQNNFYHTLEILQFLFLKLVLSKN